MVKRENDCVVLIFKQIVKGIACVYKVNITEKKVIKISSEGVEKPLKWEDEKVRIKGIMEDALIELDENIINNKNVIYSAKMQKNEKEVKKAEMHLNKHKELIAYIKAYKL